MVTMLLSRSDADARSHDIHMETMRIIEEGHQRSMAATQRLVSLENAHRIIDEQRNRIEVLIAELLSVNLTLNSLIDLNDPVKREKIGHMRSRFFDKEIERMLKEGIITIDPRRDPQWRTEYKYRPPVVTA